MKEIDFFTRVLDDLENENKECIRCLECGALIDKKEAINHLKSQDLFATIKCRKCGCEFFPPKSLDTDY